MVGADRAQAPRVGKRTFSATGRGAANNDSRFAYRAAPVARGQNFTRSPLTSATWRFVDDALPMFAIDAIAR
ncbi:hypothetical protein BPA30113_04434 [Burkholderia paludis]|uniref:Uncharacterized protein n=1 Tax=Burkholderia paludis TaxID=1506587 RepID=A0A6P2NKB9_9BURK|nr:hypothetical protein LMG30113_01797 [Burkholderia paludis]VWB95013.1 hypothetical protein BPA30113_04434 [Burkholderia paludis]